MQIGLSSALNGLLRPPYYIAKVFDKGKRGEILYQVAM
jgi:hypothetical protein